VVSNIHNHHRLVILYYLNRHVVSNFNTTYGAAQSHSLMNRAVYEHFFSSVSLDWFSCIHFIACIDCRLCMCVCVCFFFILFFLPLWWINVIIR